MPVPVIVLPPRAAKRVRGGHPWVYRTDLPAQAKIPFAALVHMQDDKGRSMGSALASSSSQIVLRVISEKSLPDEAAMVEALRERVRSAFEFRERQNVSDACRLIFSEGDRLPGIVLDRYGETMTLQLLTQAANRDDIRAMLLEEIAGKFPGASVVERSEARIRELEKLPKRESQLLSGEKTLARFAMNGLSFEFDALAGQKTGAFLDQRENYAAAERHARGEALDVFTYHGGFALHLARRCERVTGVDASRSALVTAEQNESRNREQLRCKEIEWLEADAFELLKDYASSGRQFDTILLDPPAFAKSKRAEETALRGYKEINLRALKMLRPGGVLVTNSCSHHVSEEEFVRMLGTAAVDARRFVRVLEKRAQAVDHPIVPSIPETAYLKCVIVAVE